MTLLQSKKYDKHALERNYIQTYGFMMKNSSDISYDLITEAELLIDRKKGVNEINKYVNNIVIANEIESGIFEYSLLHITMRKLQHHYINMVYEHKLHTICKNINPHDDKINNKLLHKLIMTRKKNPYIIAFLSPQQLHPEIWEDVMQKRERDEDAMYNVETTDEYECPKCQERKCTVETVQLRSADEPANKFIVCVVCGYTDKQ
jgi:DNA-directed RNA polymerase subunit M/transcription elongation factor TFIIS